MPLNTKGIALEVSLPRRQARFETGIDNPQEETPRGHQIVHLGAALEPEEEEEDSTRALTKSFGSSANSSSSRRSGRRWVPYNTPASSPAANTPSSRLSASMSGMKLTTSDMSAGPISSRTRSKGGFSQRRPRHLEALANAAAYF